MLTLLVLSKPNYLIYKNKEHESGNPKLVKYELQKILNIVKCSRNLEFEKRTDQNFITKKSLSRKGILHFEEYEYILAFAGWWSIFWEVVGNGEYILAGGGSWWVVA